jgi:hypothetical protein
MVGRISRFSAVDSRWCQQGYLWNFFLNPFEYFKSVIVPITRVIYRQCNFRKVIKFVDIIATCVPKLKDIENNIITLHEQDQYYIFLKHANGKITNLFDEIMIFKNYVNEQDSSVSESGKVGFSFNNPSKSKEEAMPAGASQAATTENKNGQAPAKENEKDQKETNTAKQEQEQQEGPAKSRGRKM